jgi:hypothetical protein
LSIEQQLRSAELAFLNAPFEADGWLRAIREMAQVTGSAVGQLCGGGNEGLTFNYFSEDRHDPHGHLTNPIVYGPENWRINTSHRARTIQFERDYAAYRSHHRTDFYDDAVSDLDLPFGCQSALMLDQNGLFGLALLRSQRDGPCSPEVIERFTRMARQAHRAVRVQIALGEEAARLLISDISHRTECTLLLDRHLNLLATTALAEVLFDDPHGLRLSSMRLSLSDPREDAQFLAACTRLLSGDGVTGPVLHEMTAGRSANCPGGRWRLVAARLPELPQGFGFEAALAVTLRPYP